MSQCSAPFNFSSRADTLAAVSAHTDLHIPKVHSFTVRQWRDDPGRVEPN